MFETTHSPDGCTLTIRRTFDVDSEDRSVRVVETELRFAERPRVVRPVPEQHGVLVVERRPIGEPNLVMFDADGAERWRTGTTSGDGSIYFVENVRGELRAIETTSRGDYQATIDLDTGELTRIAEWR